jgi:phospholipase C
MSRPLRSYFTLISALVRMTMGLWILFGQSPGRLQPEPRNPPDGGIHKIKHIITIMQENRSFDSYFGAFPGADGIPMRNGEPTVCVTDPAAKRRVQAVSRRSRPEWRRSA